MQINNKQKPPFLKGHSINFLCILLFFHVVLLSFCYFFMLCFFMLCFLYNKLRLVSLWVTSLLILMLSFVFRFSLFYLFILLFIYSFTNNRYFAVLIRKYHFCFYPSFKLSILFPSENPMIRCNLLLLF